MTEISVVKESASGSNRLSEGSGRDMAIDALKAVSILGVIIIHTCYYGYQNAIGSVNWLSTVFWGSITRASVPIFLMCSGALMLRPEKELPLKKLFLGNILRLLVVMFVWGMAYKIYHLSKIGFTSSGLLQALKETLLFNSEFHFYYLHIILLVYVFLPVTRAFVRHTDKKLLQYALALWFMTGILYPTLRPFWPLNLLFGIPAQWMMNMTYAAIGYGILGYYIRTYPAKKGWLYPLLAVVGFLFVFGGTWYMSVKNGKLYESFFEGMTVGVCLMAYGIFGMFSSGLEKRPLKYPGPIKFMSKASFCIYLSHIYFLYTVREYGLTVDLLPCIFSIPLTATAVLLLSTLLYLILSRIPVVKRWLV